MTPSSADSANIMIIDIDSRSSIWFASAKGGEPAGSG